MRLVGQRPASRDKERAGRGKEFGVAISPRRVERRRERTEESVVERKLMKTV